MQNKCCHLEKLSSNPSTETAIRHIAVVEEDRGRKRKRLEGCIYVFYDKDSRSVTLQLWLTDYIKLTTTFFYEMFRWAEKQSCQFTSQSMSPPSPMVTRAAQWRRRDENETRLSLKDKVRNSGIRQWLRVELLLLHTERRQLRWIGHLTKRPPQRLPGEVFRACSSRRRPRGSPRACCTIINLKTVR